MAVAVFDYATWAADYPALAASVDAALAASYFRRATLVLSNTDASPITDVAYRLTLLNLLVSHLAFLGGAGGGTAGLVGRVSKATEGSVSVETDYGTVSANAAWFTQSPYGAEYWQATRAFRSFNYRPGPRPSFDPLYGYGRTWRR